jgi:hypothetical protein
MAEVLPFSVPPRIPTVAPELLGTAVFLFSEYLKRLSEEALPPDEDDDEQEDAAPAVETRAVLDLFAEELGTNVQETLALYLRVTALYRLLAASPSLARLALEGADIGGGLSDAALVAAAKLDLHVTRGAEDGAADFDPRAFRNALQEE